MAAADTAKLIASLTLEDKFSPAAKKVEASLGRMEGRFSKIGGIAQRGLGTAAHNVALLGAATAGFLGANIVAGIRSLEELESATSAVQGAIEQMGQAGQLTSSQVATWADEIERNVGRAFDDKAITQATATLIRFGKVTPANLEQAMTVMTDLAVRTGDVESAAELLGKALADPTKAAGKLARQGIVLTKAEQATIKAMVEANDVAGAQEFILDKLEQTTKGAALASQGPFQRAMSTLKDVVEDAQRALAIGFLPVLEEVADWLSTELAKPQTITDIKNLGTSLADAFRKMLDAAKQIPWDSIKSAMELAGTGAKAALDFFLQLPPWVQTAVLTGWGLNKLTGGALGDIFSTLATGLIKGVLGMNAGVVNINAGVVNGPGGGIPAGGGKGGGIGAGALLGGAALTAGAAAAVVTFKGAVLDPELNKQSGEIVDLTKRTIAENSTNTGLLQNALAAVDRGIAEIGTTQVSRTLYGQQLDDLEKSRALLKQQLDELSGVGHAGYITAQAAQTQVDEQKKQHTATITALASSERADSNAAAENARKLEATKTSLTRVGEATNAAVGRVRDATASVASSIEQKKWVNNVTVPVTVTSIVTVRGIAHSQRIYGSINKNVPV